MKCIPCIIGVSFLLTSQVGGFEPYVDASGEGGVAEGVEERREDVR